MTRLKRILLAAAALVTGSAMALGLALSTANVADPEPLTAREWKNRLYRISQQPRITYFVAIQNGTSVPAASSQYILGDCAAGTCVVKGDNSPATLEYPYTVSSLVNGWRLAKVHSPRYFALGWKQAAAETAGLRFYSSYADVAAACVANFTLGECRSLISGVSDCWRNTADGTYCRYGLQYGPGVGGVDAAGVPVTCTVGASHVPYPCSDEGKGLAWAAGAESETWPADEELDLP